MAIVAIHSADPILRRELEQLLREQSTMTIVGIANDSQSLRRMIEHNDVDTVVAAAPSPENLAEWRDLARRVAFVVMLDDSNVSEGLDALHTGARAVLPRSANDVEIVAAIEMASRSLAVLPRELLGVLLDAGSSDPRRPLDSGDETHPALTPRELEVLAAIADGASNKAIARQLGISFHTVKFHVAAILSKLDADSRTEAVAKAAHLGLVML